MRPSCAIRPKLDHGLDHGFNFGFGHGIDHFAHGELRDPGEQPIQLFACIRMST